MLFNRNKPTLSNFFRDIQKIQGFTPIDPSRLQNREDVLIANMAPDDSDDFDFTIYVGEEEEDEE